MTYLNDKKHKLQMHKSMTIKVGGALLLKIRKKLIHLSLLSLSLAFSVPSVYALSATDIYQHLNEIYPSYSGITYTKPTNNYLSSQWLIQTPNIWGKNMSTYNLGFNPSSGNSVDPEFYMPTCKTSDDCNGYSVCSAPNYTTDIKGNKKSLCTVPADTILSSIYRVITSANKSVDILTLQPMDVLLSSFSREAFTATITNALISLAKKTIQTGDSIQVRFMQGSLTPITSKKTHHNATEESQRLYALKLSQHIYLWNLVSALPKGNHLNISVASMRSCEKGFMPCGNNDKQKDIILNFAFNHGKIMTVDNKTLMVGGHNLWGQDYLQKNPVNDLSIKISGPIAIGATKYANTMWDYTCKNHGFLSNLFYSYKNGKYSTTCLPDISTEQKLTSQKSGDIQVSAMSVSKLNNGVLGDDADQSEIARVYAFNSATKSIKISQQGLFQVGIGDFIRKPILHSVMTKDGTVMQALVNAIARGVSVDIVTSTVGGFTYTSYVYLKYIRHYVNDLLTSKHIMNPKQVVDTLNKNLHLGNISYNGKPNNVKSHDKLWIVDDHIFYIGSHNIYPSSLQQFGVIIDSKAATKLLEEKVWKPLWKNRVKYAR